MRNFEIGILPQSCYFAFSPNAQTKTLFLYPTSAGIYTVRTTTISSAILSAAALGICVPGDLHLELGEQIYAAHAGQVAFFDCCQPHYYYATVGMEFYYLHFDGPQAHALCQYINRTSGVVIDGPGNRQIHKELARYGPDV